MKPLQETNLGVASGFLTPKRDHVKTQNIYLFLYFFACNPKRRPSRLNMMAFWPEHPEWAQNPIFTPLSETTSIPTPFICGVPSPPGLETQMQTQGNTRVNWLNANANTNASADSRMEWESLDVVI